MKFKRKAPLFALVIFIPMIIITSFYIYQSHPIINHQGTVQLSYNQQHFNKVNGLITAENGNHLV